MECGILKVGDSVRFTDHAIKVLGNIVDSEVHIVKTIEEDVSQHELITFEDGDSCDVHWLEKI